MHAASHIDEALQQQPLWHSSLLSQLKPSGNWHWHRPIASQYELPKLAVQSPSRAQGCPMQVPTLQTRQAALQLAPIWSEQRSLPQLHVIGTSPLHELAQLGWHELTPPPLTTQKPLQHWVFDWQATPVPKQPPLEDDAGAELEDPPVVEVDVGEPPVPPPPTDATDDEAPALADEEEAC